jgi:tetratricopeptide (TPR) repeat protein/predicted Ser/Thr protein kinase
MGTVFRARDRLEGGEVALKILRGKEPREVERFLREATILAQLSHPGIVRYVAHGTDTSGEHYLAMEWLDGEDLAARLSRRGLSMGESVSLARRAAEALAFAHSRGLVHRDLKPSNLFLVQREVARVVLVDFGIARLGRESQRLTRTGALLGTPGYMAPEQIEGPPASDPRADVFALGAVLFECLTGRPAFEGTSAMSVLAKILLQAVPRPRALRPSIPAALDDLVARMMSRDPSLRPVDAGAVLREIDLLGDPAMLPGGTAPPVDPRRLVQTQASAGALTLSEQRLVTVVLAGEAETSQDEARVSTRPELDDLRAAVAPHGGDVHGLSGGSLLVTFWGIESAGDRAARAARCALAMEDRFPTLPVCVVTGRGLFSARVVEGEMIERGVRVLGRARPGAVRVDEITAGILRARFEIEAAEGPPGLEPGYLLRREHPLEQGPPSLLGQATPWVGRAREISMLEGVLAGTISEPVASAVLVVGEPGLGKSRLRRELLETLRERDDKIEILSGNGSPVGAGSPYRMIADALRRAAGIVDGDPLDVCRNKLRARISRHLDPETSTPGAGPSSAPPSSGRRAGRGARTVHFLGELAGIPFPDAADETLRSARANPRLMGDHMRSAWDAFLSAECAAHPVLLVLDDLQWGDPASVRLVDGTLRNLRDLPLMILALGRPEVHERFPNLWSEREVQSIKLGPLPRRSSEQIVRVALGPGAPAEVVSELVARGDGNPFYLEELVRARVAGRDGSGRPPASENAAELPYPSKAPDRAGPLPHAVLGMVEARLDAEGPEAKRVLRAASIFGDRFSLGGVMALVGAGALAGHDGGPSKGPPYPPDTGSPDKGPAGGPPHDRASVDALPQDGAAGDVARLLEALVVHEIVAAVSTRSQTGADPHFVFCHTLVREAAYATLTDADRVLGHRLAGTWLALQDPVARPGDAPRGRAPAASPGLSDAMTIAEHLRLGDDPAGAVRWYRRAAQQALEADDLPAAVERAARGIAAGATGHDLGHLRLAQAEAQVWLGELAAAEESGLEAAAALPPGTAAWFRAVTQAVVAASKQGGFDRVDARAALSLSATPAQGARGAQIVCLADCASGLLMAGRYTAADTLLDHLRRAVRDPSLLEPSVAAHYHQAAALRAHHAGDACAALEGFEAALSALEAGDDRREACAARCNLGVIFAELGDYESAEETLREALAAAERLGLGELGPAILCNLGHALARRGQLDEARACEARAVEAFRQLGDPRMEGIARTYLAKVALLSGDPSEAEREAHAAARLLQIAPPMRAPALALLARALLAQGRAAEALPAAREAQSTLDGLGELEEGESIVRLVHAEALAAAGLPREAERALLAARDRLLLRADRITAPAWRERFLIAVPDNARTLALSGGGE